MRRQLDLVQDQRLKPWLSMGVLYEGTRRRAKSISVMVDGNGGAIGAPVRVLVSMYFVTGCLTSRHCDNKTFSVGRSDKQGDCRGTFEVSQLQE